MMGGTNGTQLMGFMIHIESHAFHTIISSTNHKSLISMGMKKMIFELTQYPINSFQIFICRSRRPTLETHR